MIIWPTSLKVARKASLAEAARLEWEAGSAEDKPYETAEAGPSGLHTRRSIRSLEVADETDDSDELERNSSLALEEAAREAAPDEPAEAGPSEPTEKGNRKGKGRGKGSGSKF